MVLKASYISEQFKNVEIISVVRIELHGLIEHYYEVYNNSDKDTVEELWLLQGNYIYMGRGIVPIDNKIVEIKNLRYEDIINFNLSNLSENWLFSTSNEVTRGIWWNKNMKPIMDDWFISFEHELGNILPQSSVKTDSIKMTMNTFNNWREFRDFVLGQKCSHELELVDDLEISINNGNPFVKECFDVEISEHKQQVLNGEFIVSAQKSGVDTVHKSLENEKETKNLRLQAFTKERLITDILTIEADLSLNSWEKRAVIFKTKDIFIDEKISLEQGQKVFSVNNGIIEIKSCPSFSTALYSMVYKNKEWLENSFPVPRNKSWYNPWTGGIMTKPEELSIRTILNEKVEAEFVTLEDSKGNQWRGIKTHYCITKDEKYKGVEFNEFFLLLPGVPVLCHTTKISQNSKKLISDELFETFNFFNGDEELKNNYLQFKNRFGDKMKYKCGNELANVFPDGSILFGSKNSEEKLQIFTKFERIRNLLSMNKVDITSFILENISLSYNNPIFTTPVFYIFTDEFLEERDLKDLRNIYFI